MNVVAGCIFSTSMVNNRSGNSSLERQTTTKPYRKRG
jgi:hypothetical protein